MLPRRCVAGIYQANETENRSLYISLNSIALSLVCWLINDGNKNIETTALQKFIDTVNKFIGQFKVSMLFQILTFDKESVICYFPDSQVH